MRAMYSHDPTTLLVLSASTPLSVPSTAGKEALADIEFTVTTLNCAHPEDKTDTTPVHERKPRFSSLRKTGALGKAVRNKLSKSVYSSQTAIGSTTAGAPSSGDRPSSGVTNSSVSSSKSQDDEKQSSEGDGGEVNHDHHHSASTTGNSTGGSAGHHSVTTPTGSPADSEVIKSSALVKPVKKRSKLCMLL